MVTLTAELMAQRDNWTNGKFFPLGSDFRVDVPNVGHVQLIDVMGNDSAIVQAARVSYGKGTKTPSDDRTLIRYLMRHHHTTPFEQVEFKFLIKTPMDTWRQWIRHRTASVNEYSTRYSEAIDDMATTPPNAWRLQSTTNRQGSDSENFIDDLEGRYLSKREEQFHAYARHVYDERLQKGIAREQARKDLPLSTVTLAYWKINLHNLFHFLRLRMDDHAQQEIRHMAHAIALIVSDVVPVAWQAFMDYQFNAITLTADEQVALAALLARNPKEYDEIPDRSTLYLNGNTSATKREQSEFREKIEKILSHHPEAE